jgi:hypothetical protein
MESADIADVLLNSDRSAYEAASQSDHYVAGSVATKRTTSAERASRLFCHTWRLLRRKP